MVFWFGEKIEMQVRVDRHPQPSVISGQPTDGDPGIVGGHAHQ
jgi:hypothetical protein